MQLIAVMLILVGLVVLIWLLVGENGRRGGTAFGTAQRSRSRLRFEETLEQTAPAAAVTPPAPRGLGPLPERRSRIVALLELILLIALASAVIAVVILGAAQLVSRALSGYVGSGG